MKLPRFFLCQAFLPMLYHHDFLSVKTSAKKTILMVLLLFSCCTAVFSQQKITGLVTNLKGEALDGVTVNIKGTNQGTFTGADGSFVINAKAGDTLIFSSIGFVPRQFAIGNEFNLGIVLSESAVNLDKVIVTGYTAQKVKEITGSVSSVKPEDLTAVPAGQAEQMLQGRVAGLTVITSGMPGSPSNVYLHGIGNFGNVTPLYIIDGIQGDINLLNPEDIESLEVLKDAGAYAIYGVRGSNGAIIITTRKGKQGKTRITYDTYVGSTRPLHKGLDLLNPQQQADLTWLAYRNSGNVDPQTGNPDDPYYGNGVNPLLPNFLAAGPNTGIAITDSEANPALYNIDPTNGAIYQIIASNKAGTDWFHELFKPAITQSHTLTASGGGEKHKYFFSLGYLDQEGTLINTYLKRFTARVNTSFVLDKNFRIGENLQLSFRDNPTIMNQNVNNEIFTSFITWPILPVYDIKGGWATLPTETIENFNPVASRRLAQNNIANYWDILGNVYAEADILHDLTLRTSFGGDFDDYYFYNYTFSNYGLNANGPQNSVSETSGYTRSWTWTSSLSYAKTFKDIHKIKAFFATEAISNLNRELDASRSGYDFTAPNYLLLINGNPNTQTNADLEGSSGLFSLISKVDYAFKERLFLSGTLRRDGSSIFSPQQRFGWFPSVSAAWRLTQESFLREAGWLTDFKIRGSWGKTGFYGNTNPLNQFDIYDGSITDSYYDINGTSNSAQAGLRNTNIGNPNTTWQRDIVSNIGFESYLWNGSLSLTADIYRKESSGLLFPVALPAILGAATPPNTNVGSVQNTGLDILAGFKGSVASDWKWSANLTFTTYRSKVLHLSQLPYFDVGSPSFVRNQVGHPVGSFFGYKIIGFFKDSADVNSSPTQQDAGPGRFKFLDANHDGVIDANDQVFLGNPNPKFTLGINITLAYKGFDLSTFCYAAYGNDVVNVPRTVIDFFPNLLSTGYNTAKSKTALYDSWTPERQHAKAPIPEIVPNFSNSGIGNSYPVENGSYLRNKSLVIGYTVKNNWLTKNKIQRLRIYVQCLNLFTLTKYSGLDPELSGASAAWGIDYGNYPNNQKQYLIGLNMGI